MLGSVFSKALWPRFDQRTIRYSTSFSLFLSLDHSWLAMNQQACICLYLDKPNSKPRQKFTSLFSAQREEAARNRS